MAGAAGVSSPSIAQPELAGVDHLAIGLSQSSTTIYLPLNTLKTHVAIVGAAGSGKTHMAKVVVEEAIAQGVPILAIDPQGDLVQFLRAAPEALNAPADSQARRRDFLNRVEPRIWSPGGPAGRAFRFDPLPLPSRSTWNVHDEIIRHEILSHVATPLVELAKVPQSGFAHHQTFLMELIRRLIAASWFDPPTLPDLIDAILKPDRLGPDWRPDRFLAVADQKKLVRTLNGVLHGTEKRLYFGGQPFDLEQMITPEKPGRCPLNIVYLNALPDDLKPKAVARIATEIYRWMITKGAAPSGRPQLLVYLDEARDFVPAGTSKPPAKEPLIHLFAQGRKYGVCGLICTQSPRSVDYNILANCSTKLIGRLEAAQDVDRVAEWFSGGRPTWLAGRVSADPGNFLGRWPGQSEDLDGRPFDSRQLYSLHEGAWSPERVEMEAAAAGR